MVIIMKRKTDLQNYKVYYRNFWNKKLLFSLKAVNENTALNRINEIIKFSYGRSLCEKFGYKKIIITCNDVEIINCDINTYFSKIGI